MKTEVIPFKEFVNGTWKNPVVYTHKDLEEFLKFMVTGWTAKDGAYAVALFAWLTALVYGVKVGIEQGFLPLF